MMSFGRWNRVCWSSTGRVVLVGKFSACYQGCSHRYHALVTNKMWIICFIRQVTWVAKRMFYHANMLLANDIKSTEIQWKVQLYLWTLFHWPNDNIMMKKRRWCSSMAPWDYSYPLCVWSYISCSCLLKWLLSSINQSEIPRRWIVLSQLLL